MFSSLDIRRGEFCSRARVCELRGGKWTDHSGVGRRENIFCRTIRRTEFLFLTGIGPGVCKRTNRRKPSYTLKMEAIISHETFVRIPQATLQFILNRQTVFATLTRAHKFQDISWEAHSSSDGKETSLSFINLLKPSGHVMHQQFNIQQLYVLPTLYLCVLYLSENKQRLVPLTA